ncbi:unnamed protein product [Ambrosiozyma monospora]|uniref:Unnamed protein product n=1 Tax=Ambrosiozyma monospora TaxID=43982 RepID=A0ACB5SWL4_AMBMO|nr:unnamed protein product [Ambrosiozyma monospora]
MTSFNVPAEVLKITTSLPFEIQCLIIKHLIFTTKFKHRDAYWSQLVTLLIYNPILDDILTLVFQELEFDKGIFTHSYFKDIVEFVLSRSILMKRLSIDECLPENVTQSVSNFLQRFQVIDANFSAAPLNELESQMLYLKHTASLTMSIQDLTNLISSNRGILTTVIRIGGLVLPPLKAGLFLGLVNQCDFVEAYYQGTVLDINWLKKITCLNDLEILFRNQPDFNVASSLRNLVSLKRLCLSGYSVGTLFLNMIPDTLQSIEFNINEHTFYSSPIIKLPSSLEELKVQTKELPTVSNVKSLKHLKVVTIYFSSEGSRDDFEQMQKSSDRLPSTVTGLKIGGNYRFKRQLLFENFPALETLHIRSCSFDSSSLLSLQSLTVSACSIEETQQLPDTLRSLNADFESKDPINFATFCQKFILPLTKLTELQLKLGNSNADEEVNGFASSSDRKVVLHRFDKTLRYLYLDGCEYMTFEDGITSNITIFLSEDEEDGHGSLKENISVHNLEDEYVWKCVENVKVVVCGDCTLYM